MTAAVIGTGKMGSGLAKLLASKGIDVAIGHHDPAKAANWRIGCRAQGGGTEAAAKLADIVMFAVTYPKSAEALKSAGDLTARS